MRLILLLITISALISLTGCGVPLDEYQKVQDAKNTAQIIAGLLAAATVIALIVGTALGSKARHDA